MTFWRCLNWKKDIRSVCKTYIIWLTVILFSRTHTQSCHLVENSVRKISMLVRNDESKENKFYAFRNVALFSFKQIYRQNLKNNIVNFRKGQQKDNKWTISVQIYIVLLLHITAMFNLWCVFRNRKKNSKKKLRCGWNYPISFPAKSRMESTASNSTRQLFIFTCTVTKKNGIYLCTCEMWLNFLYIYWEHRCSFSQNLMDSSKIFNYFDDIVHSCLRFHSIRINLKKNRLLW